jgi:tetratricopeptide (TPR) repeat protein
MLKTFATLFILLALAFSGCSAPREVVSNPWLVPFQERYNSEVSLSQMRAMVRMAHFYQSMGMEKEYLHGMTLAVEIYAGDIPVTFELLNTLIDGINSARSDVSGEKTVLARMGLNSSMLSRENLPSDEPARSEALHYLDIKDSLEAQYEECYRILKNACGQIPYNAELYYRLAHLQYLRAEEDGDTNKYKDAINYLKRAIASDSSHLESYYLIAMAYEKINDNERAVRFWRLFEVIYDIAPEVMGEGFITPERENMHRNALQHLAALGEDVSEEQ